MSHIIVSSLIHGLIYSAIWKVMRGLPAPVVIAVAVVGVGAIFIASRLLRLSGR